VCSVLLSAVLLAGVPVTAGSGAEAAAGDAPRRQALADRVTFGAFVEGMQADASRFDRFERTVGARVGIASYYYGFGDVFPGETERRFADGGRRDVLVSWDMGGSTFRSWAAGEHDDYLDQIAEAATLYPYELYVRPWPEMNGDWQPFQPTPAGDRPAGGTYAEFRAAWRHVVTYLRSRGATNLRWVFNPTADTYPGTTPVARIWPGQEYVDVLGLDGFNWGDGGVLRWRSFQDIFQRQYRNLAALHPTAPVWICETASKEPLVEDGAPADPRRRKARWIRDMFSFAGMPRLEAVIWFHSDKERDWRVNSSPGSLRAVRRALTGG
jgi:mannan endo-1,4-beta-mannosidase